MNAVNELKLKAKRRVPRREYEGPVGLLIGGQYKIERFFQVGEGGMTISSSEALKENSRLVLNFFIANETIVVPGEVRSVIVGKSVASHLYSVEFVNLEFGFKRLIRNFVALASESIKSTT